MISHIILFYAIQFKIWLNMFYNKWYTGMFKIKINMNIDYILFIYNLSRLWSNDSFLYNYNIK